MGPRTRWETSETVTVATRCGAQLFYSIDGAIAAPRQRAGAHYTWFQLRNQTRQCDRNVSNALAAVLHQRSHSDASDGVESRKAERGNASMRR